MKLLKLVAAITILLRCSVAQSDERHDAESSSGARIHKPLPESLTSFGAAVLDDYLYVFSGHSGDAHGFGTDLLVNHFRRIKFDDPTAGWEELAMHAPAQSVALVSDGRFLYRVGGLSFLNSSEGEKTNFNSTSHFSRYDITSNEWTDLAPLPEPRSSLDAAVVGRSIYVAGGWNLQGESSRKAPWHEDVLRFDLDQPESGWKSIKGPGYLTRALSAAAHDGRLYLLGGMQKRGITRKVSIFDPQTDSWSEGPELKQDSPAAGFATSSFAVGKKLYYTGNSGVVYCLSDDGTAWNIAQRLFYPRMFLRLLPAGENRLIALGGTSRATGRTAVVESLPVGNNIAKTKSTQWSVEFDGQAKHSQVVVLDGAKLYAVGGNASRAPHDFSPKAFVDEAYVFDLARQSVEQLPNVPKPVQSGSGVIVSKTSEHHSIVVAGGLGFTNDKFGSSDGVFALDPKAKTWSTIPESLPEPRSMFASTVYDEAVWMFGGSGPGRGNKLANSVLHWWGDDSLIAPLPNVAIPTPRRSFGGATNGINYYIVGGLTGRMSVADTVDVFNFQDRTWSTIEPPKMSRAFPSLVATKDKLYLFGGFTQSEGHFEFAASLEAYDVTSGKWSTIAQNVPHVQQSMSMHAMSDNLLFYGVDPQIDGRANFVLFDPDPLSDPGIAEPMSFSGRSRASDTEKNAKLLMRKDTDKDGKLSGSELGNRMTKFVQKADSNGDSLLTYVEVKAAYDAQVAAEQSSRKIKTTEAVKQQKATVAQAAKSDANPAANTSSVLATVDDLQRIADAAQRAADEAQQLVDEARRPKN